MSKPSPKQQLFAQLARVGKGIAHPSRLELIEAMAQGEKSVEALSRACGLAFSNVSHHLQILKDCGLAVSRKEGLQVFYRLADAEVGPDGLPALDPWATPPAGLLGDGPDEPR